MRAVEDHHVDRLGVEVQQCTKLTSTNRSIGLIAFIVSAHHRCAIRFALLEREADGSRQDQMYYLPFVGLVILAERPHPIPYRTRP